MLDGLRTLIGMPPRTPGCMPEELVEELVDDPSLFLTDLPWSAITTSLGDPATHRRRPLAGPSSPRYLPASTPRARGPCPSAASSWLYLDFDGHMTTGDGWRQQVSVPIWSRLPSVSAIMKVRISAMPCSTRSGDGCARTTCRSTSTSPPSTRGVEASARPGRPDQLYGQRIVITPTNWVRDGPSASLSFDVFDVVRPLGVRLHRGHAATR